jgi:hypothetical protein
MSAALKEYRQKYREARARLWSAKPEASVQRDVLYISTRRNGYIYDQPIGPRRPAFQDIIVPSSSASTWNHVRRILHEVSVKHGVTIVDICSKRRPLHLVTARHEACYRLRHETTWSYPRIGTILGGRDHTTIIHGVRKHAKRLRELEAGQ